MKKNYFFTFCFAFCVAFSLLGQDVLITGVYDGPLSGGTPKGVELYVVNNIADLSIYGIGSANNGGGTDGEEFTFPADAATAGSFIYVATEAIQFANFFGITPNYTDGSMAINGDDAIELFKNGEVTDVFGDINTDGTGEAWDHVDGWAYRKDATGPENSTFTVTNWIYSGVNALEGGTTNSTTNSPFPIGTYSPTVSATPEVTVGLAVSGLDYFEGNGPSSEKSFTVEGVSLTADILVTAPTNFEISLTSGGAFSGSVTLTPVSGIVNSTEVYVRLKAGLGVNNYSGDITAASSGATTKTIALSGEISPADPQFSFSAFLDDFSYILSSGPSSEQTFTMEGLFLTNDLIITAPANYEVSLSTGAGFTNSVSINPSSGTISQTTIYVRLQSGLTIGSYAGDITLSSVGVTNKTIAVSGNVFGAPTKSIIITGVFDGPLSGGTPKGIEIYVFKDIADLSLFGVSSVANGAGSSAGNVNFNFPAVAVNAGTFIYVSSEATEFANFFGFASDYTSGSMNINGDDAIELYENGQVIDVYGDVNNDFSGETYDYLDGWSYRKANSQPGGTTFTESEWTFGGVDALDGETTNATATTPFPTGTFTGALSVRNNVIKGFTTYPNPISDGEFTISSSNSDKKEVKIFNILGKQVFKENFIGSSKNIKVNTLNKGIYILKAQEGKNVSTKKLVIR